jgi:hypothetical protein
MENLRFATEILIHRLLGSKRVEFSEVPYKPYHETTRCLKSFHLLTPEQHSGAGLDEYE